MPENHAFTNADAKIVFEEGSLMNTVDFPVAMRGVLHRIAQDNSFGKKRYATSKEVSNTSDRQEALTEAKGRLY